MPSGREHVTSSQCIRRPTRSSRKATRRKDTKVFPHQRSTHSRKKKLCSYKLRKLTYLLCLAGLITMCVYSSKKYIYDPIAINVKFSTNYTIIPPCITICPSDFSQRYPAVWPSLLKAEAINTSYRTVYDLLKSTNMSLNTLWNYSRISTEALGYTITQEGPIFDPSSFKQRNGSSAEIQVQQVFSTTGICETFCPVKDLPFFGSLSGIQIFAVGPLPEPNLFPEYKVIFHSRDESPYMRYFTRFLSFTVLYGEHVDHTVRLRQTINQNFWQNPCVAEASHTKCRINCIEEHIMKTTHANCRLPYIQGYSHLPMCETPEEFEEVFNVTMNTIYSIKCDHCTRPCMQIEYSAEYILRNKVPDYLFSLFLSFSNSKIEVVEEEEDYSIPALFSDVGGGLGLFLGASIFSIYITVEEFFLNLSKKK